MVNSILSSTLREQAGSVSFNRFDYQAHWIVYHMICEYINNSQFFIFCEFHDDMAKSNSIACPECMEFFQIKTSDRFNKWTLERLCKTTKKRDQSVKHSFLGFIFYNFNKFNTECSKCHFISNIGFDIDINTWQSVIEDDKILKDENNELYEKIKRCIRNEYNDMEESNFSLKFDLFIQNTFIYYGDLPLEGYEKIVAGHFFNMLENENIYTSNSNKILRDIIEEVRKKSKKKITVPISYKSLSEQKGISSNIFLKIKEQVCNISKNDNIYTKFQQLLVDIGFHTIKVNYLLRRLKQHHAKMLNISNSIYQDKVIQIDNIIDSTLNENYERLNEIPYLKDKVIQRCNDNTITDCEVDLILVEVLFYERIISN